MSHKGAEPERESAVIGCLAAIPGLLLISLLHAVAFKLLWGWFAPFAPLTVPQAFGLSLLVSLFRTPSKEDREVGETANAFLFRMISKALTKPVFVLALGWVVHALFQ